MLKPFVMPIAHFHRKQLEIVFVGDAGLNYWGKLVIEYIHMSLWNVTTQPLQNCDPCDHDMDEYLTGQETRNHIVFKILLVDIKRTSSEVPRQPHSPTSKIRNVNTFQPRQNVSNFGDIFKSIYLYELF